MYIFLFDKTAVVPIIYEQPSYKLFGPREGLLLINESKQWTYKSSFTAEMKQDKYSTARPDAGATEVIQLNPGGPDQIQSIKPQST